MPVTPTLALCTVADVERELGVTVGSITGDALAFLEATIDALSQAAEVYLGRGPLAYAADVVEFPRGRAWPRIRLRRTPIRVVDEVKFEESIVDPDRYIVESEGRTGIVYFRDAWPFTGVRTPGVSAGDPYADTEAETGIEVTYDAGWWLPNMGAKPALAPPIADLPSDIRRAVTLASSTAYRNRGADRTVESERLLSHAVTYARDDGADYGLPGFTSEGAALLRRRRRVVQA